MWMLSLDGMNKMRLIRENSHCWFTSDYRWGIIELYSRTAFLLYKQSEDGFYIYQGLEFYSKEETVKYIEGLYETKDNNHKK